MDLAARATPAGSTRIGAGPLPEHAQLREIPRRLTVRTAVGRLVEDGVPHRVRGRGTVAGSGPPTT